MARPTCETCISIDVRRWYREGRLEAGQNFSCSWVQGERPAGSIKVRTEQDAVVICGLSAGGARSWRSIEQEIEIVWTACRFGGRRPCFRCPNFSNGRICGRRAAILYYGDQVFACRECYDLVYASQQETPVLRGIRKARKIRKRLGGDDDLLTRNFPLKPKGMHRQTYLRLREQAEAALACACAQTMKTFGRW